MRKSDRGSFATGDTSDEVALDIFILRSDIEKIKVESSEMTEDEKQTLRDSFVGKSVSQMTPAERAVFDADFQYGFGGKPVQKNTASKDDLPKEPPASNISIQQLFGLFQKK